MDKAITRTCYSKNEKLPELIACSAVKFFKITDERIKIVIPCVRHHDIFINDIGYEPDELYSEMLY